MSTCRIFSTERLLADADELFQMDDKTLVSRYRLPQDVTQLAKRLRTVTGTTVVVLTEVAVLYTQLLRPLNCLSQSKMLLFYFAFIFNVFQFF